VRHPLDTSFWNKKNHLFSSHVQTWVGRGGSHFIIAESIPLALSPASELHLGSEKQPVYVAICGGRAYIHLRRQCLPDSLPVILHSPLRAYCLLHKILITTNFEQPVVTRSFRVLRAQRQPAPAMLQVRANLPLTLAQMQERLLLPCSHPPWVH